MKRAAAFCSAVVLLVMTVASVNAAAFARVYIQGTQGGASSHVEQRLADCYMSDDNETQIWEGDLAAGASVEITWDWCSDTDIVMEPGYEWEGSFEGLAVDITGKGDFILEVLEDGSINLPVHSISGPKHGYIGWSRCATYHNRVDVTGTSYGFTVVRVTNTGTRAARDLSMDTHVGTNHSGFLNAFCPFRSDWGF